MDPNYPEDRSNQISGFKAAISNPNTSKEAKDHARNKLKELDPANFDYGEEDPDQVNKNTGNVAGGLKAAVNNPNVSEEGKKNAQEKLNDLGK